MSEEGCAAVNVLQEAHRQAGEADADELLWIEGAVPVLCSGNWLWQHHPSCIGRLPDAPQIHPPCDLLRACMSALHKHS
jgi:hypothetical protein